MSKHYTKMPFGSVSIAAPVKEPVKEVERVKPKRFSDLVAADVQIECQLLYRGMTVLSGLRWKHPLTDHILPVARWWRVDSDTKSALVPWDEMVGLTLEYYTVTDLYDLIALARTRSIIDCCDHLKRNIKSST